MLACITYFIVTVVIRFVQRAANLAAAGRLVVGIDGRLPARYTGRILYTHSHTVADFYTHDTLSRNRRHKLTGAGFRRRFVIPYASSAMKFLAPKINMAESDVDDEFAIKLKQEIILKRKQLSWTNHESSFQSRAPHFLAWNRTVFQLAPVSLERVSWLLIMSTRAAC